MRLPTFYFQLSIISKWLAKRIRTKVSFKITIRKTHVYIDISWPWILNQFFYLWIWNDYRTKIIDRLHFSSLRDKIQRTEMKLSLLMNSDTLNCIWLLVFPIGIIEVSIPQKNVFAFISFPYTITDLQVPETL